jgi:hypothetical protein
MVPTQSTPRSWGMSPPKSCGFFCMVPRLGIDPGLDVLAHQAALAGPHNGTKDLCLIVWLARI